MLLGYIWVKKHLGPQVPAEWLDRSVDILTSIWIKAWTSLRLCMDEKTKRCSGNFVFIARWKGYRSYYEPTYFGWSGPRTFKPHSGTRSRLFRTTICSQARLLKLRWPGVCGSHPRSVFQARKGAKDCMNNREKDSVQHIEKLHKRI